MPVVLSQIFEPGERIYKDAEGSLYHYPRIYFSRIVPYDRFIYYRPAGKRRPRPDASHYFGHGILGVPFEDLDDEKHRFVPLLKYEVFPILVPLRDQFGRYYETESHRPIQGVSAVRASATLHTSGYLQQRMFPQPAYRFYQAPKKSAMESTSVRPSRRR